MSVSVTGATETPWSDDSSVVSECIDKSHCIIDLHQLTVLMSASNSPLTKFHCTRSSWQRCQGTGAGWKVDKQNYTNTPPGSPITSVRMHV